MRLLEFASELSDDLVTLLRNQRGRANSQESPAVFSYKALDQMLKNQGHSGITYQQFMNLQNINPQLKTLVKDFDEETITLNTKEEPEQTTSKIGMNLGGKSVEQAAKSGVRAHLKKISK